MSYFIHRRLPTDLLCRYVVLADRQWPFGRVVGVTTTRAGARRIARKDALHPKAEESRPLVEVMP